MTFCPLEQDYPGFLLQKDYVFRDQIEKEAGYGDVFKVQRRSTGETYALKTIQKGARDADLAAYMLRQEARVLTSVQHPNIIRLQEDFSANHPVCPHLLLEFVGGESLEDHLADDRSLTERLQLAVGVVAAVARLHEAGWRHNDLHPKNVVVDETNGWPLLLDFGLALSRGEQKEELWGLGREGWIHDDVREGRPFSQLTESWQLARLTAFILCQGHVEDLRPDKYPKVLIERLKLMKTAETDAKSLAYSLHYTLTRKTARL